MTSFVSYDPSNGEPIGTFPLLGQEEADCAVSIAAEAFRGRRSGPVAERVAALRRLRASLAEEADSLATILSRETGKPLQEAYGAELLPALKALDWLIRSLSRWSAPRPIPGVRNALQSPEPYGVVGVIGTWNYPLLLDIHPIVWAVAAGNVVVWKPSELATATATALHTHLKRAGLPVQLLTGAGETGRALCRAGIDKLAFTGGVATGRAILAQLAERGVPAVMELSGNDAMIVCADADVTLSARSAVWGRCCNAGQSCVAPQRLYVAQEVLEPFLRECVRVMRDLRPGVDYGPLRTSALRERAHALTTAALAEGACLKVGGAPLPDRQGAWYAPTLLSDCRDEMAVLAEDFFGPVLPVRPFSNEREAVACANASDMALGASVWTRDRRRGRRLAAELRVGVVAVNTDTLLLAADPRLPFGGMRASGFGRQHGAAGLNEFVQWKTVVTTGTGGSRRHLFPYRKAALPILRGMIELRAARSLSAKWQALRRLAAAAVQYRRESQIDAD